MQEVVVQNFCDIHFKDSGEKVPAVFSNVIAVGEMSRKLDLCEEHRQKVVGDLAEVLADYGVVPTKPRAHQEPLPAVDDGRRTLPCQVCGTLLKSKGSLGHHTRTKHGITLGELMNGKVADRDKKTEKLQCEVCDFTSHAPQGLASHRRLAHKLPPAEKMAS